MDEKTAFMREEVRISRLRTTLHSLETRIPVIPLQRIEEIYPILNSTMVTVSMYFVIKSSQAYNLDILFRM